MIAVDTNILVYAHHRENPFHDAASACVRTLAEGRAPWALPWPCLHEFVSTVTHRRIFQRPSSLRSALNQVEAWLESPSLLVLAESDGYWPVLTKLALAARLSGPRIHDA